MSAANSASAARAAGRRPATISGSVAAASIGTRARKRVLAQQLDRRVADAAARDPDRPAEGLVVRGVGDQLQVRHQVADLAAVVEPHGAHEPIGDGVPAHRLFHRPALRVGPVEDGEVPERPPARDEASSLDLLHHERRLVALVEGGDDGDAVARARVLRSVLPRRSVLALIAALASARISGVER